MIWYNSCIRVSGRVFLWMDCYKRGLKYVHQLFRNLKYKTTEEVWQEFGLTTLRFNSLKKAIPKEWKSFFVENHKGMFLPLPPSTFDTYAMSSQVSLSQEVYKYLNGDISLIHGKFVKWNQELEEDLCEDIFVYGKIHMDIYKVTNIPKYRSFQYRLLQRALITNLQLYKWGIVDTNLCFFCKIHPETIVHLLCECTITMALWAEIKSFIQQEFGISIELGTTQILCNEFVARNQLVNFIGLIAKQYIYRQKCLKQELSMRQLLGIIRNIERIEKYIASKNSKLTKHNRKWARY